MVNTIVRNYRNGNKSGRFFELAHVFKAKERPLTALPEEVMTLVIGAYGDDETFFTLKGMLEGLAEEFGIEFTFAKSEKCFLHPGMTAEISVDGEVVGYMGRLSHQVSENLVLGKPVFIAEIDYDKLKTHFDVSMKYVPISQFSEVDRDFAFVCDEEITCGEITEVMKKACKYITKVNLFDIFRSEKLGENKKSMAFNVTFTPDDHDFSPKEMDKFTDKILKDLEFKLNIKIR
jgi:phenylalanyl-tRNA synthetase beta chain